MPTLIDLAFVAGFAVVLTAFEAAVFFPRFKRAVAAGKADARQHAYRRAVIGQWLITLIGVVLWSLSGRSWKVLGFVPPFGARGVASAAIVVAMLSLLFRQSRGIARLTPERRAAIRPKFANLEFMLPHTPSEYRWFLALSLTAGICEETLYRGYLLWVVAAYVGSISAVVLTAILFGIAHLYQGRSGGVKAAVVALVMGFIVIGTGWLIPAMVVHAAIDASSGTLGFEVLRDRPESLAGNT